LRQDVPLCALDVGDMTKDQPDTLAVGSRSASGALEQVATSPGFAAPGTVFGSYRLLRLIGRGGRGAVYEAVHVHRGTSAAVKVLDPGPIWDAAAETRLLRQAEAIARLRHPHLTEIVAFGHDRGAIYLVSELLRGEDLAAVIARTPAGLDPIFCADTLVAVCAAVFAAHEAGVLHRNLKPSNVFLARSLAGEGVPRVLDFGVSCLFSAASPRALVGGAPGHHLAPEQVRGEAVDERTDVYALGAMLYHGLTGRVPHPGDSTYAVLKSITTCPPPAPRSLRPELAPELELVVMRALALAPDQRFRSVREMGQALAPFASPRGRAQAVVRFPVGAATLIGYRLQPPAPAEQTERVGRLPILRQRKRTRLVLPFALAALAYFAVGLGRFGPFESIEIPVASSALPDDPIPAPPPPTDLPLPLFPEVDPVPAAAASAAKPTRARSQPGRPRRPRARVRSR
jgi:serine/threonine-protein kinase